MAWLKADRQCNRCYEKIEGTEFANPAPDLHFHNTPAKPCFYRWLVEQLKAAIRPKEK